ncbi:DegT/DnrJ/EryC1/StrS family aminotransferase, partial [SAR202 cluster bacterium AD-812-D07_MRT_10900m]|nr:DegT/DnrJ/EryC1/StrS family aminotransferase [SAR202 cluster bacterium AD-812-D07_MRT_10900m]
FVWISRGPMTRRSGEDFAAAVGATHAIALNSGTAALHVALAALGVGPGDEVIVPSLTFISSANVILYLGAKPVLVECDPNTFNVTPEIITAAITSKTKAVMPVDMNGIPLDYDPILRLCAEHDIAVVADSAEALGSEYRGVRIGSQAPIHCFSFFPNKTITTGEGGMVTCVDNETEGRIRQLVNQGQDGRYNHVALGFNYRMTEMQAALGISQLSRLDAQIEAKEKLAQFYDRNLEGVPGLELAPRPEWATAQSWFMYSLTVANRTVRDEIAEHLATNGIDTRLGFPPIHNQPYYRDTFGYKPEDLPISMQTWERKIDLPSWPKMTAEQRNRVAAAVKEALSVKN